MADVNMDYKIAYAEVLEVLEHMDKEYIARIPVKLLNFWKQNALKDYDYVYDENKDFKEQDISKKARVILAIVYRDCYASKEEREGILKGLAEDRIRVEEEKREKYDPEKIFDNNKELTSNELSMGQKAEVRDLGEEGYKVVDEGAIEDTEQAVTNVKEGLWRKIVRKMKSLFGKKE